MIICRTLLLLLVAILACGFFYIDASMGFFVGPYEWLQHYLPWHQIGVLSRGNPTLTDAVTQIVPNLSYIATSLRSGEVPYWTNNIGFGIPLFLVNLDGHFHLTNLPYLVVPPYLAATISVYSKHVLMALGSLLLFRTLGLSAGAVCFAVVSMTFSQSLAAAAPDILGNGISSLPLLLYSVITLHRAGYEWQRSVLLFCFSLCLIVTSGFLSLIAYQLAFAIALFFTLAAKTREKRSILYAIIGCLLSALLLGPILFETIFYLWRIGINDVRSGSVLNSGLSLNQAPRLLFPDFWGDLTQFYANGMGNYFGSSLYPGILAIPLTLVHFLFYAKRPEYRKRSLSGFWSVSFVILAVLVFDIGEVTRLLNIFPVINKQPIYRLNSILVMVIITCAAYALDELLKRPSVRNSKASLPNTNIAKSTPLHVNSNRRLLTSLILILATTGSLLIYRHFAIPFTTLENVLFTLGWPLIFLIICFMMITLVPEKSIKVFTVALVVCCFIDLRQASGSFSGYYNKATFYPQLPTTSFLMEHTKRGEKFISLGKNYIPQAYLYHGLSSPQTQWFQATEHRQLLATLAGEVVQDSPLVYYIHSLDLDKARDRLSDMNVKYIVTELDSVLLQTLPQGFRIVHIYNVPGWSHGLAVIEKMDSTDFKLDLSDGKIKLETQFPVARSFALPVWNYPGWQVTFTTFQADLLTNEKKFIELQVPAGHQQIELEYRPLYLNWYLLSWALALGGCLLLWRGRR